METVDNSTLEEITCFAMKLPAEQQSQLLALVASWKTDLRRAQRQKYTELLNFNSGHGSHYGKARDISATGVFIESTAEFQLGEHIRLILTFISAPNPLTLRGTVKRITARGIGVQFDNCSQGQLKHMDTIISKHALILRQK